MASNYRLHKRLGALYRESGYQGPYGRWLREEVGYTKGCRGGEVNSIVERWVARHEAKKRGEGAAAGAAAVAPQAGG